MYKVLSNSLYLFTFLFFCLFSYDAHALSEPLTHTTIWFKEKTENQTKYIAEVQITLENSYHTYSSEYNAFPTRIVDGSAFPIEILYPQAQIGYDNISKKELPLYKNTFPLFLVFKEKPPVLYFTLSLLLCSDKHCRPYSTDIKLTPFEDAEGLPSIQSSKYYKEYTQSKALTREEEMEEIERSEINLTSPPVLVFTPQAYVNELEVTTFGIAIFFGLIAGFILNLMPCVLPVIAIKISSLISASAYTGKSKEESIRTHAFYFAMGILTLFTFLAFLFGAFDMLWGQLFQHIYFIIFLVIILFLFALSLMDLFYLPIFNIKESKRSSPRIQAYTQGLMATLIATPCSGPLLGGVLGFSLTLPFYMLITVFISTGLGMALPYLAITIFPRLVAFIPKAGNWTVYMEKTLAFLMLAAALYLLSILPPDKIIQTLILLLVTAFAAWLWSIKALSKKRKLWALLIMTFLCMSAYFIYKPADTQHNVVWNEFTFEEFERDLGKIPMLVDFTADWCPTCKIIEKTSLSNENMQALLEQYDIKLVRVDMTKKDNVKETLLRSLGSASIPLLAIFPKGTAAQSPTILRDIFTFSQLKQAVKENL